MRPALFQSFVVCLVIVGGRVCAVSSSDEEVDDKNHSLLSILQLFRIMSVCVNAEGGSSNRFHPDA